MTGPTSYSVTLNLKPWGADGFSPVNLGGQKTELTAILLRSSVKQNGVDTNVDQGFIQRFLDNLRQTNIFSNVLRASEIPPSDIQKRIELNLAVTQIEDTHQADGCIYGCLVALTLGLLSLVITRRTDFSSEMVLEVKRWDGAMKLYSAKSSGVLNYGIWSNRALGGLALGGAVTTANINSLMSQMIADIGFYVA